MKHLAKALVILLSLGAGESQAQNFLSTLKDSAEYRAELSSVSSSKSNALWLVSNRYGLSSVEKNNACLLLGIGKSHRDSTRRWNVTYGLDVALTGHFTSRFVVQQLYVDVDYRKVRLSVGSKERPMALKHQQLSSGGQLFGINARPIPEVRIEIPDYIPVFKQLRWLQVKGHFGYGFLTDGRWQKGYVAKGNEYTLGTRYHSKSGYLKVGDAERFPLVFEGGLEMATQFGGTYYNPGNDPTVPPMVNGSGLSDYVKAIYGGGRDFLDGSFPNASGNIVGAWLFRLSYQGRGWGVHAYLDHFFEDHSQAFLQYGWKDGLYGVEVNLPENPFVSDVVYEYLTTRDQSGAVYHDHTPALPIQISGADNYYNHGMYNGWEHWGQAVGNPLFYSPLFEHRGALDFSGTRFNAHHFGISGRPTSEIAYRLLFTHTKNWGTYGKPYVSVKHNNSYLVEINWSPASVGRLDTRGWSGGISLAGDHGAQLGNTTSVAFKIRKTGTLFKKKK